MTGKLYVVGTPIGNLGDMTFRAVETLKAVDFIAAEDTRVTSKLLNHFEIKKPQVSYHDHSIREKGEEIVRRILGGESCAIVTDAGMPCISDPGEDLVALCVKENVPVVVVPGASAVIAALAISGQKTARFSFEGFLTVRKAGRTEHLESLIHEQRTLIFYEAPHKLLDTLKDMLRVFGERNISLARELTKIHEEVLRMTLSQAVAYYTEKNPRGEYVLVVEGASPPKKEEGISFMEAVELLRTMQRQGISLSAAAKDVATQTGYKKGELYKAALAES